MLFGFVSLLSMLVISRLLLVVVVGSGASEHFGKEACLSLLRPEMLSWDRVQDTAATQTLI